MDNTLALNYYLKALDNYPWDLEGALESIHYALSYDDEFAEAYALKGKIYSEQFNRFEDAQHYFNTALSYDLRNTEALFGIMKIAGVYKDIQMLSNAALQIKKVIGVDKAKIHFHYFMYYELNLDYAKARKSIKKSMKHSLNWNDLNFYKEELKRLKEKMK